jgi:hypothetical protein
MSYLCNLCLFVHSRLFDFFVLNATFSNILAISWRTPAMLLIYSRCVELLRTKGPGGSKSRSLDYLTTRTSLSPIRHGFAPGFVNYKKRCTRLAAASDKVNQLLAHCRWVR